MSNKQNNYNNNIDYVNKNDEIDEFDGSDMFVDFSDCVEKKKNKTLYDEDYDATTTKFYRTLRENKINAIMQDNTGFYPERSFKFKYKWDPYTGERLKEDPYGPLYFHPDDLIRYFYNKRLNMLWTDPVDENHGYHLQGYYGDAVGSGEEILIIGRGTYPESYLFRLPIYDCYLQKGNDMSIISMGPKLTNEEVAEIDNIAATVYKNNYKEQYGRNRPSLSLMKALYDQAVSREPDIKKFTIGGSKIDLATLSKEKLKELREKANRSAVDMLRKM